MSDYSFLQSIEGGWKQLKKWTLQKVSSAPVDSVEGGVWYNETSKRIGIDIGSESKELAYVDDTTDHNSLLDKDGGDTVNNYYGHVKEIHNNILENFGEASGVIVSDANNYIPIEQIPVGLLGGLTPKGAWNPATNTPTLSNPPLATTRGWFYIASTSGTALGTDWASTDWCISDGTVWQKIDNTDKVSSVFGRTGNVVAAAGDYNLDQVNDGTTYKRITSTEKTNYNTAYTHSQITNANPHGTIASQISLVPVGGIASTNVQGAFAELDSEKQPIDSTLTAIAGLTSGIPLLTSDSAATSINRATLVESLRANTAISGGGIISVSSSNSIKWSNRFIVISNGKGSHFSTGGYFNITMPSAGTVITGLGTSNKTVDANGILLGAWDALYYILPIGLDDGTVNANFRLVNYQYVTEIPETWVLLALRNADTGYMQFPNGVCLYPGESKTNHWQHQIDGKSPLNTTLADNAASSTLPTTASGTLVSKIQALRDNVKYILANWLQLGETSATAYRGDRGKVAYDHSQLTASNPHGTTAAQISSTATGDISATNVQAAIAELASEKLSTSTAASTYATIASVAAKQNKLTFDDTPVDGSANPVTSNGIFDALSQKVSTTRNYWNAAYVSDSYRWVKIASITTSDGDYTSHCLFIGKSFYGAQHYLQGHLLIAQNGFDTGSTPAISFVGQQKAARVYYTFNDTANLLEIYLYLSGGSGGGLPNGITTNIITSTDPSRITLLTSGTALASVAGAIEVNYLAVNPRDGNVASNSNLVIGGGSAIIGNTHIGNWSQGADRARFGHSSHNNTSGFGFIQNSGGSVSISAPAAQEIYLGVGGNTPARIDSNGFLHINPPALTDDTDTVPTTAWVKDTMDGKVDEVAFGGLKNYPGEADRRWRGIAQVDSKSQYNGGTLHVEVTARFFQADVYLRFAAGASAIGIGEFVALWEGSYSPEFYVVASGFKAYVYCKDPTTYCQTSVIRMSLGDGTSATIAPLNYNSATHPGAGTTAYHVRRSTLRYVNGLTSDAQTQITAAQTTADSKLARSGDTMTGPLNFANNTLNAVGDDCAIGDINEAGLLGLRATQNVSPGICFMSSSGAKIGALRCDPNSGRLYGAADPLSSSDSSDIATTSWVKDVAAPINATLADNAASSTLPTTASGTLVSKIQQTRDYLKYLLAQLDARARTFSYKASSIDGINLWTLIASFSPVANTTYNFGISLSQAGSDFPWSNAPFDLYVAYRDGVFDVRGYFTTDRAAGDIYYGVVGGVLKVFLRNWSNWATAYGGTILFDSHGVVNFASSTTTAPTGMTVYTPLERPVPSIIGDGGTLPAGAPIGKTAFVDGSQVGYSGAVVNAPSGDVICRAGAPGGVSSSAIGSYRGCWFVKTTPSRWVAVGAL